jgi:hypothetical protein
VFETEHFEHEFADSNWFKGKQTKVIDSMEKARKRNSLVMTKEQKRIFKLVKQFVLDNLPSLSPNARLTLPSSLNVRDRRFLVDLAGELHLEVAYDEFDENNYNIIVLLFDDEALELARAESDDDDDEEAEMAEWKQAIHRVLFKYGKAEVAKEFNEAEQEQSHATQLEGKMNTWKKEYYKVCYVLSLNYPPIIYFRNHWNTTGEIRIRL